MNGKIDVAAIGEVLIDFAQESVDALGYPTMAAHPGGAPCNFLAALSALGMKTAFLGKVGEDDFGLMLRHTLDAAGIDTRGLISDPDVFTTLAFVRFDENRDRSFSFARKPGADTRLRSDELDLTVIDECRMLHFGTLSLTDEPARSATQAAVEYARRRGKLISFDPNLRFPLWPDRDMLRGTVLQFLPLSNILKISDEELEFLTGTADIESALPQLFVGDVQLVLYTCGSSGAHAYTRTAHGFAPCREVRAVDTTGAGDFYAAGFMYGLTCGYSLEKCVQISTILATAVIQEVGTTLPAKKWDEIKLNIESLLQV